MTDAEQIATNNKARAEIAKINETTHRLISQIRRTLDTNPIKRMCAANALLNGAAGKKNRYLLRYLKRTGGVLPALYLSDSLNRQAKQNAHSNFRP